MVSFKSDDVRCEYGFELDIDNPIGINTEPGSDVFQREHVNNEGNEVLEYFVTQIVSDRASDDISSWVPCDELQKRKQYRNICV